MSRSKDRHDPSLELPLPLDVPPMLSIPAARSRRPDPETAFFDTRKLQSKTKSKIVVDTFLGWAGVLLTRNPVALWYFDLYCGRGKYGDGSPSTPLELFDKVAEHPQLPALLKMVFNDHRRKFVLDLRHHMMEHPGWDKMRYKPTFDHGEVDETTVSELRARVPKVPTFAFIDPFGYKGLTQELIEAALEEFGCDVMFYFAYHPIKRVLNNRLGPLRHVEALLGAEHVRDLRRQFTNGVPERELELSMLSALAASMRRINGQDVLTFAFRRRSGAASHHLAFVSKNLRGYEKAKEAMARSSSWFYPGDIPSFEFVEPGYDHALSLSTDAPSLERLKSALVRRLKGKRVTLQEAYDAVMLDTPYVRSNVREAFVQLVRDHAALLFSGAQRAALHGTRLPKNPEIVIPVTLRRP